MTLTDVHAEIDECLGKLKPLFTRDCILTFIMRKPGMPSASLCISNDEIDDLIEQLEWFKANMKSVTVRKKGERFSG